MIPKTELQMRKDMRDAIGSGITLHEPTPQNRLGQSGLHTVVDDVMDIFIDEAGIEGLLGPDEQSRVWKALIKFFSPDD